LLTIRVSAIDLIEQELVGSLPMRHRINVFLHWEHILSETRQ
jgi:hypothetical protein